jgi:phage terminase large subunit-like protein
MSALTGGGSGTNRARETQSRGVSPTTATVRTCQLEGCSEQLTGRQKAYCSDAHRNKAFKQARREATRAPARPKVRDVATIAVAPQILGYREPRFRLVPPSTGSRAAEAIAVARSAGLVLDAWQEDFLEASMGVSGGSWAASEIVLILPRQNGKTAITAVRAVWEVVHAPNRLVVFTSHLFKTDREAFRQCRALLEAPAFAHLDPVFYRSNGNEAIELNNGSRIQFLARSGGSGRGFTAHLLILDEAFDLSEDTFADLKPSIVAAEDAQLWVVSSAPHPDSEVLRRICLRGRAAEEGNLVYAEYSASDEAPADSVEGWRQANPALGIRIPIEAIASGFASMSRETFEREHLGRWAELDTPSVFPAGIWESLAYLGPLTTTGSSALALDITPARDHAAVVAAALVEGGKALIEVVAAEEGTSWVVPKLQEIAKSHANPTVVLDRMGPASALVDALRSAGLKVHETDTAEYANACAGLFDSVLAGTVIHRGDSVLDQAVQNAEMRPLGDRFAWKRKTSAGDLSPLVAASLAHFGATTLKQPKQYWLIANADGRYVV